MGIKKTSPLNYKSRNFKCAKTIILLAKVSFVIQFLNIGCIWFISNASDNSASL